MTSPIVLKSRAEFWQVWEECLCECIAKNPMDYMLQDGEPQEVYARRIRERWSSLSSLRIINLGTASWKRLSRRLGFKIHNQGKLTDLYNALSEAQP